MSTSTIFIKQPLNYRQSLALLKQKYREYSGPLSVILWTFSGLYTVARSNFNTNITGLSVSFCIYDLLLMLISSVMLYQGLYTKNLPLLFPWILVTTYSVYFNHYRVLLDTLTSLRRFTKLSWLPWSNLLIQIFLLIIRGTLTIRVFQLGVHLWFKNKLKEMKEEKQQT